MKYGIRAYFTIFVIAACSVEAQEKVYSLDAYEFDAPQTASVLDPVSRKLDLQKDKFLTLSGPLEQIILNQGIGKTVNIYGKTLVIEEVNPRGDGSVELVMRQENGKDFFNYYPKVRARLISKTTKKENKLDVEF